MRFLPTLRVAALALATTIVAGAATSTPSQAQTVRLDVFRAGFIIGGSSGEGVLNVRRRAYPLEIDGLSFGATVGIAEASLRGRVIGLRRPSDIEGVYSAASAGASIINGTRTIRLQNANGVVLELSGPQTGLEFSFDLSGLTIRIAGRR